MSLPRIVLVLLLVWQVWQCQAETHQNLALAACTALAARRPPASFTFGGYAAVSTEIYTTPDETFLRVDVEMPVPEFRKLPNNKALYDKSWIIDGCPIFVWVIDYNWVGFKPYFDIDNGTDNGNPGNGTNLLQENPPPVRQGADHAISSVAANFTPDGTAVAQSPSATTTTNGKSDAGSSSTSKGKVVAAVVGVVLLAVVGAVCWRHRNAHLAQRHENSGSDKEGAPQDKMHLDGIKVVYDAGDLSEEEATTLRATPVQHDNGNSSPGGSTGNSMYGSTDNRLPAADEPGIGGQSNGNRGP